MLGVQDADTKSPLSVDEACAEAILGDIGAGEQIDDVVAAYGLADTLAGTLQADVDDTTTVTGLYGVVYGLDWLLGADLGQTGDLEEDDWTDAAFVDELDAVADDLDGDATPLARALYDYVAAHVSGVRVDEAVNPGLDWFTDVYRLSLSVDTTANYDTNPTSPSAMASVLVHEARHDVLFGRPHVDCEPPAMDDWADTCDPDLSGAYGFGIAVQARTYEVGSCSASVDLGAALSQAWEYHLLLEWPGLPPVEC